MITLISKAKNLYMVFNTRREALDFAFEHLSESNLYEDILAKKDEWFSMQKSNGKIRFVIICVYEHKKKL